MSKNWVTVSMCVEARVAFLCARENSKECLARTHHARQRSVVWVAFLGRWQPPINVVIMKEIENMLFSPLRGCFPIPYEVPYASTRRFMRSRFRNWLVTNVERQNYLAALNRELLAAIDLLERNRVEMGGANELCYHLECELGLELEDDRIFLPN